MLGIQLDLYVTLSKGQITQVTLGQDHSPWFMGCTVPSHFDVHSRVPFSFSNIFFSLNQMFSDHDSSRSSSVWFQA